MAKKKAVKKVVKTESKTVAKPTVKVPKTFVWTSKTTDKVLGSALQTLSVKYPALSTKKGEGKLVFVKGGKASECSIKLAKDTITITYNKVNMALRMVGALLSGVIPEKPDYCPFEMFGVMIDCSRNAVMTVDYMKSYLDRLAILGYNMAMLYTEETYQIKDEPFFGLMRGAYSPAEIREIDGYAAKLGIELIPCIQTLAHLEQMFRWPHFDEINDIYGILLVDEPKTYELIEKMLVTWKSCVRSRRIHLGMDEAHGVGDGKFKQLHGTESRFDIINRHLKKVVELCKKHGLEPMMWSDMFFRCGSKNSDYYDKNCVIPKKVIKDIPKEIELVYWDYYHENKDFYTDWIARHRAIAGEPLMGSGIWTWNKFWYDHIYTTRTVVPCIEACRESKVKDVFFTMWGDDGGFCDYDSTFAGLAFAGELAFTGKVDDAVIEKKFHHLFKGASYADVLELAKIGYSHLPPLLWDDPLMQLYIGGFIAEKKDRQSYDVSYNFQTVVNDLAAAAEHLAKAKKCGECGSIPYAKSFVDALLAKVTFVDAYLKAYRKKNNRKAVAELIPQAEKYSILLKKFIGEFRAMWFRHNKPFGLESVQIRLAGQSARAEELVKRLKDFADGKAMNIPETEDLFKVQKEISIGWWPGWARISHGTTII